jgi:hypothetical protein
MGGEVVEGDIHGVLWPSCAEDVKWTLDRQGPSDPREEPDESGNDGSSSAGALRCRRCNGPNADNRLVMVVP